MSKREHALDFLKITATLLIVLHHYQQSQKVYFEHGINFFGGKFYFGYLVELFFILSGFFTYGYIERIRRGLRFSEFFLRRYLRFLPMQAITVTAFAIAAATFEHLFQMPVDAEHPITLIGILTASLCVQSGWVFPNPFINNPTWYISVLLLCYVVFFLIIWIARRMELPLRPLFVFVILLGIGLLSFGIELPFLNSSTGRGYCAFFWGLLLADLMREWQPPSSISLAALCVLIGFPFAIAFANDFVQAGLNYTMTFVYYPALIVVFRTPVVRGWFRSPVWAVLADISFNVYMWHSVIFVAAGVFFFIIGKVPAFDKPMTIAGFVAAIYLTGALSWYFIDRPTRRLAREFIIPTQSIGEDDA